MKRRRLITQTAPARTGLAMSSVHGTDLGWLAQVVVVRLPVRAARTFLNRAVGNPVSVELVELARGEKPGVVRSVEVRHARTGERTLIRGERRLASGEGASFFVPDHLVKVHVIVEGPAGRTGTLDPDDLLVLQVPVRGYLRYLPAIFQGEGPVGAYNDERTTTTALQRAGGGPAADRQLTRVEPDADPLRRLLFVFQHLMTTVTDKVDRLGELTDPLLCEPAFLPWLASWVGFELDESLPVHQQRELVRRAIRLYRTRGTRAGIEEMVQVLTAAPVRVQERALPAPVVLGRCVLAAGPTVSARYLKGRVGASWLYEPSAHASTDFFALILEGRAAFHERFGERAVHVLHRIADVVSGERPCHVAFTIRFDDAV